MKRALTVDLPGGPRTFHIEDPVTMHTLQDAVEKQWPEFWAKCYPRVYDDARIGQHYSPKLVASDIAGNILGRFLALSMPETQMMGSTQYDFILSNQLARFGVPTFFLSRGLAEALAQTTPPQELAWHDMELPYEACAFMLPRGLLAHPDEGDCTYVAYARAKYGEMQESPFLCGHRFGILNGGFIVHAGTVKQHQFHYHWPYTPSNNDPHKLSFPVLNLRALDEEMASQSDDTSRFFFPDGMTQADNDFVKRVAHYVFSSVMVLLNRPDLVERGRLLKRVQRPGKPQREFWSPNMIGAHYRIAQTREAAAGTHQSPRAHWRRGHWRQQPYGAQRSLRRDTWIEPMLINAD